MLDTLPRRRRVRLNESAIVNLDSLKNLGTHWVAFRKCGPVVCYFDSYGNLKPPYKLEKYLRSGGGSVKIFYNYPRVQNFTANNCGHLCLRFLLKETP